MATKSTKPETKPADNGLQDEPASQFPLMKINFILMAIAAAMIIIGFCLTSGGAAEADSFNPEIFSVRRTIIGPNLAFLGFIFMGVGIMWPSRKHKTDSSEKESK